MSIDDRSLVYYNIAVDAGRVRIYRNAINLLMEPRSKNTTGLQYKPACIQYYINVIGAIRRHVKGHDL